MTAKGNGIVVTGTLIDAHTVALDRDLPLPPGRVRVVVERLPEAPRRSYQDVVSEIRARQQARGHRPPSRAEVDAYLKEERASWDEE